MINTSSLTDSLHAMNEKNIANKEAYAIREKIGHCLEFSSFAFTNERKDKGDIAQIVQNVSRYLQNRIAKNINKTKSFAKESSSLDASERILQRAKEKTKSKGNVFSFSEHDQQEIDGVVSMFLSVNNTFAARPFNLSIDRNLLALMSNFIKSKHCLDLNRFRNGKHASLDAMQGEKGDDMESNFLDDDEFFNCAHQDFSPCDFAHDCDDIAENNQDFDSLEEKIDAINSMIDCFHDASDSRKKESARKADKQFFLDCVNHCATGNGDDDETMQNWRKRKSRFLETIKQGFFLMKENSNDGKSFNNFSHLATLFKS